MNNDAQLIWEAYAGAPQQQQQPPAPNAQQQPTQQPSGPKVELHPAGKTQNGANIYQVLVNGYVRGAAIEFNRTLTFADTQMNQVLGTNFKYSEVDKRELSSLDKKQFKDQQTFIQAAQQALSQGNQPPTPQ